MAKYFLKNYDYLMVQVFKEMLEVLKFFYFVKFLQTVSVQRALKVLLLKYVKLPII